MGAIARPLLTHALDRLIRRSLRRAFRRVVWCGPLPDVPPDAPVVLYANHHSFYDGYLFHVLLADLLGRPGTLWMHDWDRFPFFALAGVQPFPPDDPARRGATLRRTVRRMRETPGLALVLFPEGRLHSPDDGVSSVDERLLRRLGRILPAVAWCPIGVHVTWHGDALPTALLMAGPPHPAPDGHEPDRLETLLRALRTAPPTETRTLVEGRAHLPARWSFAAFRPLFERHL